MQHRAKILAGTCAALALTASLAFAARTSEPTTTARGAAATAAWNCPSAQYGPMGRNGGQRGYGGCMWGDSGRRD